MTDAPRFCIHLDNVSSKHPVFHMTPAAAQAALAEHPAAADRIAIRIGWDGQGLAQALPQTDMLVCARVPALDLRHHAPRLRCVHATGAGIDGMLPLDWLPDGVVFTNSSGVHAAKAQEFALMALLMLNSRMPQLMTRQHAASWQQVFTGRAAGKTVLIIGFGDMGRAAARAARQLGMRVIAATRHGAASPDADVMYPIAALDSILSQADMVVLATPLTTATRHLLNASRIAAMRPGAGLINVARAGVIDGCALRDALHRGHLSGAVIDVFEQEPLPPDSPWWSTPNLIITPHISSDDADRYIVDALGIAIRNALALLDGAPLTNVVDGDRGY
jgi:phosphoglycerate dehydrogenase-like enzyme